MLLIDPQDLEESLNILEEFSMRDSTTVVEEGSMQGLKFVSKFDEQSAMDELIFRGVSVSIKGEK